MADSAYALYLQSTGRIAQAADAAHAATWGPLVRTIDVSSPIALEASANAEATALLAFFKGPLVEVKEIFAKPIDVAFFKGKTVTINGHLTFILGGGRDEASGTSYLEGLRKGDA